VRRPATWLAVAVVLLVGVAAAADAVREKVSKSETPPTTTTPAETTTQASPATGLSGVLYYSDEQCRLRGVQLPDLEQVGGPDWTDCAFALSPDARDVEAEGAVWSPTGTGKAVAGRGKIAVEWTDGASYSFAGSAPAFRGNGDLTFFSGGAIRQLPPRCSLRPVVRRCSRLVVPRRALELAARQHPNGDVAPGFLRVSVPEMAWLGSQEGPERLVALVRLQVRTVGTFDLLALFERGRPYGVVSVLQGLSGLRASPGGSYFGVLIGAPPGALFYDRDGGSLTPLPLTDISAFDWSHDEAWVAVATPYDVYVARAENIEVNSERLRRLGIVAADLAWRGVFISL
jgi:hypothetical protein